MALEPGSRVGPYEVESLLGAGGMGEVYRARDSRLKRHVALKVLPPAFVRDLDRLARFQREAEVLATLNHPNIGAIYGLEQSDESIALVLELVDGETLAERLARGPMALDEALPIARQIAEALEASHEHGIIHRDLKPANVKVSGDGVVKVLDFGLAKLAEKGSDVEGGFSRGDVSASPTITSPALMTGAGVILGTAAYMAPEQAKGQRADRRSDVWAFGCVLFEMLAGRRAFEGDDVADTMAAILRGEPAWTALPRGLPAPVIALLRQCLEKERQKRISDVAPALAIVEDAIRQSGDRAEGRPYQRALVIAAVMLAMAGGAAGLTAWIVRPASPRVSRLTIAPPAAHSLFVNGRARNIAISPDGTRIAYVGAGGSLLVRPLDSLDATVLVRDDGPVAPFFSPDGRWIGYFPDNRALQRVAVDGGPTVMLTTTDSAQPGGATWAEDGTVVFATNNRSTGLLIVAPGASTPTVLTVPDRQRGEADHLWPEFLPGGRALFFTITSVSQGTENTQVALFDLTTGQYKTVMPGGSHAHYVPTGHMVYSAAGTLRAVPFDIDRLEPAGASVTVVSPVLATPDGAADFDVAVNGTLVYVPGGVVASQRELVWMGRDRKIEPVRGAQARPVLVSARVT